MSDMTTWTLPGLQLRDLTLSVPLDHADPAGAQIEVFARVIAEEGGEDRPYLVYLQGGPGSEAPRLRGGRRGAQPRTPSSPLGLAPVAGRGDGFAGRVRSAGVCRGPVAK